MQGLNRRRKYLNTGRNIFWYDYASIRGSSTAYTLGIRGTSLGDAAVFAGGGRFAYTPSAYSSTSAINYADYINKDLVRSNLTNLTNGRFSMGCALVYDVQTSVKKVFFMGGSSGGGSLEIPSANVDIYTFGSGTHTTMSLSSARTNFGCTTLDNKIFIAGGRNTVVGNNDSSDYYNRDLVIYNNNGQSIYTSSTALSERRYRLAAVANDEYVMFAGGAVYSSSQYTQQSSNKIDVFNKNGVKISTSINLNFTSVLRYGPSGVYYKNNFMISTANGMNVFNKNLQSTSCTGHPNRDLNIPCLLGKYALFAGGLSYENSSTYAHTDVCAYTPELILLRLNSALTYGRYDGASAVIAKKYALFVGAGNVGSNYADVYKLDKKSDLYVRIKTAGTSSTTSYVYGAYLAKETSRSYSFSHSNMTINSFTFDQQLWEANYLQSGNHVFAYSGGNWYKDPTSSMNPTSGQLVNSLTDIGLIIDYSNVDRYSRFTVEVTVTFGNTYTNLTKITTTDNIFHIFAKTGYYSNDNGSSYNYVGVIVDGVTMSETSKTSYSRYVDIYGFKVNNRYVNVDLLSGNNSSVYSNYTDYVTITTYPLNLMFVSNEPVNPVPAGNIIRFSVLTDDGSVYFNAEINMTWSTFISSSYNTDNKFSRGSSSRIRYNGSYVYDDYDKTDGTLTSETIVAGKTYYI